MPRRETKRGAERTPLRGRWDVVICGASFAGLAVARELQGSGARTLLLDRYAVGERQTSACGIPTMWLDALGLEESIDQTFGDLLVHTPHGSVRWRLPWTFSTFDYRTLCQLLREQGDDAEFETATVDGRSGDVVHTDRGDVAGGLVVDALGWRRVLGPGEAVQPPEAYLSRGLEIPPDGRGDPHRALLRPGLRSRVAGGGGRPEHGGRGPAPLPRVQRPARLEVRDDAQAPGPGAAHPAAPAASHPGHAGLQAADRLGLRPLSPDRPAAGLAPGRSPHAGALARAGHRLAAAVRSRGARGRAGSRTRLG